jgi:hypothetical protein
MPQTFTPMDQYPGIKSSGTAVAPPPDVDPWAHRADKMKCWTCMWFLAKQAPERLSILGRCRRHAPALGGWPAVFEQDWCGDHKLDESKA